MSKAKKKKNANKHRALSAQQTIPYIAMHPDGICQLPGGLYTKTLEYEDINYAVASTEDQTAIISGWSACLNYFDSSLPFQLSFVNRRSRNANRYKVNIPAQEDAFNSIRGEYVEMLKGQIAKSNNGIERYKYITFGLPAEGVAEARPRLGRVEADVMGNLKRLGVQSRPLDGRDRLAVLHGQMHPGGREPFRFAWKDIPKTGMGTKDYIAPDSFDFRQSRTFRVGQMWGAASYLQIMASELSDKLLAEILELDAELTVTISTFLSTRLTPDTAASPTEDTIRVSARPMVTLRACSAMSGSSSATSACRVKSGLVGFWVLVMTSSGFCAQVRKRYPYHTAPVSEIQGVVYKKSGAGLQDQVNSRLGVRSLP